MIFNMNFADSFINGYIFKFNFEVIISMPFICKASKILYNVFIAIIKAWDLETIFDVCN